MNKRASCQYLGSNITEIFYVTQQKNTVCSATRHRHYLQQSSEVQIDTLTKLPRNMTDESSTQIMNVLLTPSNDSNLVTYK